MEERGRGGEGEEERVKKTGWRREGEGEGEKERDSEKERAYKGEGEEREGDRTLRRMILCGVHCVLSAVWCVVCGGNRMKLECTNRRPHTLSSPQRPRRFPLLACRLSASCELVHASPQEDHWRHLIKVRRRGRLCT